MAVVLAMLATAAAIGVAGVVASRDGWLEGLRDLSFAPSDAYVQRGPDIRDFPVGALAVDVQIDGDVRIVGGGVRATGVVVTPTGKSATQAGATAARTSIRPDIRLADGVLSVIWHGDAQPRPQPRRAQPGRHRHDPDERENDADRRHRRRRHRRERRPRRDHRCDGVRGPGAAARMWGAPCRRRRPRATSTPTDPRRRRGADDAHRVRRCGRGRPRRLGARSRRPLATLCCCAPSRPPARTASSRTRLGDVTFEATPGRSTTATSTAATSSCAPRGTPAP
ncbi:MAG: hypothetical protein U0470_11680 [Anaerolineae bacterium]